MNTDLIGCNVLIARPEAVARDLSADIAAHGGASICMQLFAIESLINADLLIHLNQALRESDIAVCISRNAAELVMPHIDRSLKIRWACIGPATAQYLHSSGCDQVICPAQTPFDSQSLLKAFVAQEIPLTDSRVLIIAGLDGDFWLRQTLLDSGAIVDILAVYKRIMPQLDMAAFSKYLVDCKKSDIMLITCVTSLINLHTLAAQLNIQVLDLQILVVSERIAKHAIEMGHRNVYTSSSMSDQDIMRALLNWRALNV